MRIIRAVIIALIVGVIMSTLSEEQASSLKEGAGIIGFLGLIIIGISIAIEKKNEQSANRFDNSKAAKKELGEDKESGVPRKNKSEYNKASGKTSYMIKSQSNKMKLCPFIFIGVILFVVVCCLCIRPQKDYYSKEYVEDLNWYLKTCSETFNTSYKATTLLFCDCGYYEFRNKYGDKRIYGRLSVSDVLGVGSTLSQDDGHEVVIDSELSKNIKQCHVSEIEQYKKEHPDIDIDKMWGADESHQEMIIPRRLLGTEAKWW